MLSEEHISLHKKVVEVHGISLTAALGIAQIDVLDGRTLRRGIVNGPRRTGIVDGQHKMVLGHRDAVGHRSGLIHFVVKSHLLDNRLHQRTGIRLIVDGEIRLKAQFVSLGTQDAGENRVKGSHLQIACSLVAYQTGYTLLHLTRCLIGKRQCQNLPRLHALFQ